MQNEAPECFYRISVKALVFNDDKTKFLIAQEEDKRWEFPGGGLDWGETPQEGIKREIDEEMGLEVTWVADNPSYFLTVPDEKRPRHVANVFYETKVANLDFTPSKECIAVKFVSPDEINELDLHVNVARFAEIFNQEN